MQTQQLKPLTSLRFFAAVSIVIAHLGAINIRPLGYSLSLDNGVSFFFVLSGFILTLNYYGKDTNSSYFYLSRISRILPVHVVTTALFMFLFPRMGVWAYASKSIFFTNLFLIQSWITNDAYSLSFNSVSWSISTEMFFYLMFPLILTINKWLTVVLVPFLLTACVLIYGQIEGVPVGNPDPWGTSWSTIVLHFPPMRIFEFTVGMASARQFILRRPSWRRSTATFLEITSIVLTFSSIWACQIFVSDGILGFWTSQCGSFWAFAILIYVFAASRGVISACLSVRVLVRLGDISFSTYMIHHMIIKYAFESQMYLIWTKRSTLISVLIVIYVLSYVLWRGVELPFRRAVKSMALNEPRPLVPVKATSTKDHFLQT